MKDFTHERKRMVEQHLRARDISDEKVLSVMGHLARERFVSPASQFMAYNDFPIPIGKGQTISQPYMIALMTQMLDLQGDEKVLEIGTGSGYQAAILGKLAKKVITIEREKELVARARKNLLTQGLSNVKIVLGDGTEGYMYNAPFDRIIVTAGSEKVPRPLLDQLSIGGKMVIPLGGRALQHITLIEKKKIDGEIKIVEKKGIDCRFVPLRGKHAW